MTTKSDFPELTEKHTAGAKLYANRNAMLANLPIQRHGRIAEIGVALGDFSKFMIEKLSPTEFYAFDLFEIHKDATLWGRPTVEVLEGLNHRQFYERTMKDQPTSIFIEEGLSANTLAGQRAASFDMIYVDASHTYEDVKVDGRLAANMLKVDGMLIFNDYIMHDPFIDAPYGIVPAVNEMIVNEGWRVVGFALQKHMFCDIAIKRA